MRYFQAKTAANLRRDASMWDYLGESLGNEIKHTGAKSLRNIASAATFGLIPGASASVNPNDRYLSDGMKTTRRVLQGIGETAGALAAPMGVMKGLSSAYRAASGAVNTAGKAAPWLSRATKYTGDKVLGVNEWFKTPVLRAARQPGYQPGNMGGYFKALGSQIKNDSLWGNTKTLGSMVRRVGGELVTAPMAYSYRLSQAPTVGAALKDLGGVGAGLETVFAGTHVADVFRRNRVGERIQSGDFTDSQWKYLAEYGIGPDEVRVLQREYGDDWTKHPILREAGIDRGRLIEDLEYV